MAISRVIPKAEVDEQAALLKDLAGLVTAKQPSDALRALVEQHQWTEQELLKALKYHGIAGLVAARVKAESTNFLHAEKTLLVATEALRVKELEALFLELKGAAVHQFVLIKGGALAYSLYPAAWQRPRTDLDILVEPEHVNSFFAVLESLGFRRLFAITGKLISYQCSYAKALVGDATFMVDVHWKISNRQCLAEVVTGRALMQRSQVLSQFEGAPAIPSLAMSLLIACIHRLGHHFDEERLTWLYDIHLLVLSMSEQDWDNFTEAAKESKTAGICLDGIRVSASLFDTDIPNIVLEQLSEAAKNHEPSQILLRDNLSSWDIFRSDLGAFRSYRHKLRFMYETAVPSSAYLRQQMNTDSSLKAFFLRAYRGTRRLFGLS